MDRQLAMVRYNLTALEAEQLVSLQKTEANALLDRVLGVLASNPLSLEEKQFEEVQHAVKHRYKAPELAERLRLRASQLGGLLRREAALRRYDCQNS